MITLLSFLFYLVHKDNIQWICIPFSQKCRFSSDFAFLTPESLHSHFWVFSSGQINLKGFHLETNSQSGSILKHFALGFILCKRFAEEHGKTHISPRGTTKYPFISLSMPTKHTFHHSSQRNGLLGSVAFGVGAVCVKVGVKGVQCISSSVLAK